MPYSIEVSHVSKKFKIYREKSHSIKELLLRKKRNVYEEYWALKDISFNVTCGTTVGIIGRNGSGKSTMLKIVAKILYPDAGVVHVRGRVSALLELGAGFQPDYTGRENIYLNGSILGLTKKEIDSHVDEIIEFSELGRFIDTPVRNYSSGMYMRLAFAIAVTTNPDILIIDEVLAVGDEQFQKKCFDKLHEFKRQGKSILFVSHSDSLVEKFCDEVILLHNGQLLDRGKPKEVFTTYRAIQGKEHSCNEVM
ncbi:ABC transporter ATP-binding protein [Alicyclobacillus macrosporangiidus]|uniref:ABC transporter ATP-binding protein n=1 Tax=Alicyclobacillus macrosporangiidus TaxID=392015 RepID=UPI0005569104|nr:ABC transporter ATP-binding protein [Alicyclobacillus macrosporangiidus]